MKWPFRQISVADLGARDLLRSDAQDIADIHAQTFKPSWTDGEFAELLGKDTVQGIALSAQATDGGAMLGFVLVRIVSEEAEILTIAVAPKWQRHGIGRRLMDLVLSRLHAERIEKLFLEVDEENEAAVSLYRKLGFNQVATRKNYYDDSDGNKSHALVMRCDVG